MNKAVRMSTSDRLIELAVRNNIELDFPAFKLAAQAIMNQLIPESTAEPTFDDLHFLETERRAQEAELAEDEDVCERDDEGHEKLTNKAVPLFKQLQDASISERIRRAMFGNSTERLLLVRDSNRLVAEAAAKSPRMTENDAARMAASRSVRPRTRIIANNRELVRSYQVEIEFGHEPADSLYLLISPDAAFARNGRPSLSQEQEYSGGRTKSCQKPTGAKKIDQQRPWTNKSGIAPPD